MALFEVTEDGKRELRCVCVGGHELALYLDMGTLELGIVRDSMLSDVEIVKAAP